MTAILPSRYYSRCTGRCTLIADLRDRFARFRCRATLKDLVRQRQSKVLNKIKVNIMVELLMTLRAQVHSEICVKITILITYLNCSSYCNGVTPVKHQALAKLVSRLFTPDELG